MIDMSIIVGECWWVGQAVQLYNYGEIFHVPSVPQRWTRNSGTIYVRSTNHSATNQQLNSWIEARSSYQIRFFKNPSDSSNKMNQLNLAFRDDAIADTIHPLWLTPLRDDYGVRTWDNSPLKDTHMWIVHSSDYDIDIVWYCFKSPHLIHHLKSKKL